MSDQHDHIDDERESAYDKLAREIDMRITDIVIVHVEPLIKRITDLERELEELKRRSRP